MNLSSWKENATEIFKLGLRTYKKDCLYDTAIQAIKDTVALDEYTDI